MNTARILRWSGPCVLLAIVSFHGASAFPQSDAYYTYDWQWQSTFNSDGTRIGPDWLCLWLGYGTGVVDGTQLWLNPMKSTSPGTTHSAMVSSSFKLGEFWGFQVPVTTVKQLRTKKIRGREVSSPNPWEVAWLVGKMTDDGSAGLYFIYKTNGVEMGAYRYSGAECIFLFTAKMPKMVIGDEHLLGLSGSKSTLTAFVDGKELATVSLAAVAGWQLGDRIGLYTEDAMVSFGRVEATPSVP
jgi:hypothetical protein